MDTAQVPQVQKRLYRNNTGGYIGVVQLDHQGAEKGVNVDPFGTVWLSDAEVILTARAPVRAEDNPFEEQVFWRREQTTGERKEVRIRPITLESVDARYVPANDRYVPTHIDPNEGRALATAGALGPKPENVTVGGAVAERTAQILAEAQPPVQTAPEASTPEAGPPSTGSATPTQTPPPAPVPVTTEQPGPPLRTEPSAPSAPPRTGLSGSAVPPPTSEAEQTSWDLPAPAPGQVLSASLSGSDEPSPGSGGDPTLAQPGDAVRPPQAAPAPPQTPGAVPAEEFAAAVDPRIGEETGAARPPAQPQPEGEYASREEVGSPNAPTQVRPEGEDDGLIG